MEEDGSVSGKALLGWRVLVPRTPEQARATVASLSAHGAHGVGVPTIAVVPPTDVDRLHEALRAAAAGDYAWVVFTSVNAVVSVRDAYQVLGYGAEALGGARVASVGGVTSAALRRWGVEPEFEPRGRFSAAGVVEEFAPRSDAENPRILLPRADIATDVLPAGLTALGWQCDDVPAYRTVPAEPPAPEVRAAITGGGFDAALFTSASTVRNLVAMVGPPHPSTVIACIGHETRDAATALGLRVDVVPGVMTSQALVDALAAYGRAHPRAIRPS